MFVLLRRVRAWRSEMLVRGVFSPGEVAELEDHLLEEAGRLAEDGRSDDEAFVEATRRLGTGEELVPEYRRAHALGGVSASVWLARGVPWVLRICRWARGLFLFLLPGLVMAVPGLVVERFIQSDIAWIYNEEGLATPGATRLCWQVADILWANGWWLLPLGVAVLLAPSLYRLRQARDRADASLASILAEDLSEGQPLLLAGVLIYPLVGFGAVRALFDPLIRMVDVLGG